MFDITPEEIALLNDEDLRSLVGQLCEAELRSRPVCPLRLLCGAETRTQPMMALTCTWIFLRER